MQYKEQGRTRITRTMLSRSLRLTGALCLSLLFSGAALSAEPIAVKYPEGSVHGFLALRSLDGKLLASGDLVQTVRGTQLISRLTYRFKDGSIDDETAIFTQNGHFHLVRDRRIQQGPSFPRPIDMTIDAETGEVTVRFQEDGKPKVDTSHMDLPDDLANGILLVLVKNLSSQDAETKVSFLAATPKPRIVHLVLKPDGTDSFRSAGLRNTAQRYRVHIDLGGVVGAIAPLIGKQPEDSLAWVSGKQVPAFMKSESPLYLGGPLLRTELIGAVWQQSQAHDR